MAHINLIKKLSLVLLFAGTILSAETVYTLSGVNKVYPVVEISGIKVPKTYKAMIYSALKKTMDDLKIDYQGYNQRALAVIVNEIYVGKTTVVN
ncbi:MAG: hypothetical protein MUP09_06215, partial [Thiovulaceae bacterium]|nr:hypothetical protein [Sulfurimonadaceae bacterium]